MLREHYAVLKSLQPLIASKQGTPALQGFWQYRDEKRVEFDIGDFRADIEYRSEEGSKPGAGIVIALAPDTFVMAGVNYSIRFPSRRDKPGNTAWLSIDELLPSSGEKTSASVKALRVIPGCELVPGRRLNGDEAWYRVNLGPKPRILVGKVYRFFN